MQLWYNRDGSPGDMWSVNTQLKDKRVAETTLPSGKWVSTVYLGINHSFMPGPPLIFETMVFASKGGAGEECDVARYSTEEQAIAGHVAMVKKWSGE